MLLGVLLVAPAGAIAKTVTASAGGVKATLTYGVGAENNGSTTSQQLLITRHGKPVYEQPVPVTGCFKLCDPEGSKPVHVADLYGDGGQDVVLTLFTGGADCCTIDDVFVPSAAVGSYVLDQHNFGEDGAVLKDIGPNRRPEFVSADPAFYCRFSACYASGLPIQIFEFSGEHFVNVTKQHPVLISDDAAKWLKLYHKHPAQGQGLLAAWLGDEENLDEGTGISTVINELEQKGDVTKAFVASLARFLKAHHYNDDV
jgi:hypothetical protein